MTNGRRRRGVAPADGASMREAKLSELKTRTLPVLTALVLRRELAEWFPVQMHPIAQPFERPEAGRAALVQLDAGHYVALCWGETSNMLMLRIPANVDATEFVSTFLQEVPLPQDRIRWCRSAAYHPKRVRRARR
jgi:hypothetical protein